jgi:hypothetical protein
MPGLNTNIFAPLGSQVNDAFPASASASASASAAPPTSDVLKQAEDQQQRAASTPEVKRSEAKMADSDEEL